MESFEAVVRAILARIRAHQIPRKVPTIDEIDQYQESGRRLYAVQATAWGSAGGSGVPASRFPQLDPGRQPAEPRAKGSRRRSQEEFRLPNVHEVPTPRGLLVCHPRRHAGKG